MKPLTSWMLIAATALLIGRLKPAACAAQPPPAGAQNAQAAAAPFPSAVCSDIERFVKASGRDKTPPNRPSSPRSKPGQAGSPPAPVGQTRAVKASARQGITDLPPALSAQPATNGGARQPRSSAVTAPSPLATQPRLKPAPVTRGDLRFPINLATALRLSDARPLIVAAAQARVWVAEGALSQAKVLWFPDVNLGFDYLRHDGGGPDFNKGILTAPSTNFFYGGGGLTGMIATTDAIYEPLVARQVLNSRHWDTQSAKNDALMETANAYFMVHQYRGIYASALFTVEEASKLVSQISGLSRDLTPRYEVDRARNMLADLQQLATSAREQWRVQSAKLSKVLRLDPRAVVDPMERDHLQITLIDPARELDELMPIALTNRPEIASRLAMIQAAAVGIQREKARPVLPIVLLNGYQTPGGMLLQAGIFGIGPNNSLNQWTGRDDFSIQCVWQLENLGIGNLARIKSQRGEESRAIVELRRIQDSVAEDVNRAHARVQSAAARVTQAERSLRTGLIAYNGSLEGLEQTSRFGDVLVLISRPQEAIYALQLLQQAFDEYYTTVAEYNRSQFDLFHALGYPAQDVSLRRSAGDVVPVDTNRPAYLPAVGSGPPPATR
jgi:outer membrane protein TolC